ncbi:hypothetical protein HDU85_002026 [Gaertneriomyces sp. JEL0708]|nr:hypothetical protein HDU85_002026 [Gaertneriomyces sp. JEL0708]
MATAYTVTEPDDDMVYESSTSYVQVRGRPANGSGRETIPYNTRDAASDIFTSLRFLVGVGRVASGIGFEAAKAGTKFGLGIARGIVDGVGDATGSAAGVAPLVSSTIRLAEFCALAGIETGRFWTNFGLSAADHGVVTLDGVFGSSELALAVRQFAALVRREVASNAIHGSGLRLVDVGAIDTAKHLMAWACLQYTTADAWNDAAESAGRKLSVEPLGPVVSEPDEDVHWTGANVGDDHTNVVQGSIGEEGQESVPSATSNGHSEEPAQLTAALRRYIKFATGVYGRDHIGAFVGAVPSFAFSQEPRSERQAFARHTETPIESLFHSTQTDHSYGFDNILNSSRYKPTLYVIEDHSTQQILVVIRGTKNLHDLMVDLTCDYEEFCIANEVHHVHSGMMKAAQELSSFGHPARLRESVDALLETNPSYSILLTGHSLGAGLATCLALHWAEPTTGLTHSHLGFPPGRRVRCYAFAPPAVASAPLSQLCENFVTSIVVGDDFVPRLSLGSARDLAQVVAFFKTDAPGKAEELIQRVALGRSTDHNYDDIHLRRRIEQACMTSAKLYPAGRVLWIVPNATGAGALTIVEVEQLAKVLGQILFTKDMGRQHLPGAYHDIISRL